MDTTQSPPLRAPPPLPVQEETGFQDRVPTVDPGVRFVNSHHDNHGPLSPPDVERSKNEMRLSLELAGISHQVAQGTSTTEPQRSRSTSPLSEDIMQPPNYRSSIASMPVIAMQAANRSESPRIVLSHDTQEQRIQSKNISYGSASSARSDGGEPYGIGSKRDKRSAELSAQLPYHHRSISDAQILSGGRPHTSQSLSPGLQAGPQDPKSLTGGSQRPQSSFPSFDTDRRGRTGSPSLSPNAQIRSPSSLSSSRKSPSNRPVSYIDLLNIPYPQQAPSPLNFDHAHLQHSVGNSASLLSTQKTLEMYRANVKKTNDMGVQYSFAEFMVQTAKESMQRPASAPQSEGLPDPAELVQEARSILQKLAEKSYPFAQYYLADGYASGLFSSKSKEDNEHAFPLFVAASKHGHAESGYRAALCYEFGWGTRKDPLKAAQFYRHSASKGHPGAMTRLARACLTGDLGLGIQYKEGIKWLKRATESADQQYNIAPFELGRLHETGYGDDVFEDEPYAAQLFTQAADLGHAEAAFRLGDAYEHGKLHCPKDPALSIHFYSMAAARNHDGAMMGLCAWYMVGAPPFLEKDEKEAYEWSRKAAELGLMKAQYAVAYFAEMGIGCRRDPLEANAWYVKAAEQGDEKAMKRLAAIRSAASGAPDALSPPTTSPKGQEKKPKEIESKERKKKWGIF